MTLLYGRRIVVSVAEQTIRDLRIQFAIERHIDPTQQTGRCIVHNLSPANEGLIYEAGSGAPIEIQAGYPETLAVVYNGYVEDVRRVREDLTRKTDISLADTVRVAGETPTIGGYSSLSLRGPRSVRSIVHRIVLDMYAADGLAPAIGPLDAVPAEARYTDWYFSGSAAAALTVLLATVECTWYEDDGVIRINRPRPASAGAEIQSDAPTIAVSPESGLIGRPTDTAEGAEIVTMLDPAIVLGCRIDLQSDNRSGAWKVVALRHLADNWKGGPFQTWCDLRALADEG